MASESAERPITTHTLQAPDLPISNVTVYTDRAEVVRQIELKLASGLNQIVVENVAKTIIGDSIRVDGKGEATIHEVRFKEEYLDQDKISSPKIESLKAGLNALKSQKEVLEDANALLEKQIMAIGEILTNVGKSAVIGQPGALIRFDNDAEQSLELLCSFHERKSKQLKDRSRAQKKDLAGLEEKIGKLQGELDECWQKGTEKKSILVELGSLIEEDVELVLTYQVYQARWWPSYDVRVQMGPATEGGDEQLKSVKVSYFGMISQRSGEEWKNVQLGLTTAKPSCGRLPRIGTTYAEFYRPPPPPPPQSPPARMAMMQMRREMEPPTSCFGAAPEGAMRSKRMAVEQTVANEENMLSTTFSIPQPKTIKDDGSEHKVTIALLDFDDTCLPHLDCVPSKDTSVFLSATMINNSMYPLLAGMASIYMNNCFSQKIHLESVSPGEKFDVPLGIFGQIKVTYKPANKFHNQTGVLTKSSNLANEQKMLVKNNSRQAQLLTIIEPIPKATDEKIKIRLLSPEVGHSVKHVVHVVNGGKAGTTGSSSNSVMTSSSGADEFVQPFGPKEQLKASVPGARLNADHNLEWTVQLEAGQERELIVRWEAEFPANEKLELQEKWEK